MMRKPGQIRCCNQPTCPCRYKRNGTLEKLTAKVASISLSRLSVVTLTCSHDDLIQANGIIVEAFKLLRGELEWFRSFVGGIYFIMISPGNPTGWTIELRILTELPRVRQRPLCLSQAARS